MSLERTESMARAIRMMADGGYTLTDASFSWTRTTEELSEDSLLSSDSLTGGEGNDVDNSGVGHDSSTPSPLPFDGGDASELSDEVSPPTTDGRYDDGYRDGQRDGYIAGRDGVLARLRPTTDEDAEAFYETFGYTAATWDQLHRHEQDGYRRTLDAAIAVAQERGLVPPMRRLPEWVTVERLLKELPHRGWATVVAPCFNAVNAVLAEGPEGGES